MPAPAYMPFYVGDYMADTHHLDATEHGAYMLLIMTYWQRQEPLPDNDRMLAKFARVSKEQWAELRDVIEDFFEVIDGAWRHKRIDAEISRYADKSAKAAEAARARNKQAKQTPSADASGGIQTGGDQCSNVSPAYSERKADDERTVSERSASAERTMCHSEPEPEPEISMCPDGHRLKPPDGLAGEPYSADATEPKQGRKQIAERMREIWAQELGDILQTPRKLTEDRIKSANARFQGECERDFEAFRSACQRVRQSAFLRGEAGRDSWKGATFDWLLKPKYFVQVIEGNYDDRPGDNNRPRPCDKPHQTRPSNPLRAAAEQRAQHGDTV